MGRPELFREDSVETITPQSGARLQAKQRHDIALWKRHRCALEQFLLNGTAPSDIDWQARLEASQEQLEHVSSPAYLAELVGTIGSDPFAARY